MSLGFDRPLYILPFDHRGSFQTTVLAEFQKRINTTGKIPRLPVDWGGFRSQAVSLLRGNSPARPPEKDHKLFAGFRADVVVHAHDFDAGDPLDHRFHDRGAVVSIKWVRTCLRRSLPFSAASASTSCCSAAVKTPRRRTMTRSPITCV